MVIGHRTGRQLQRRPGYAIDVEKVLRACAQHDGAVEINAHPWRLDLDWRWHQAALEFGCLMSINPDAHSVSELDHMLGIEMARKGRPLLAIVRHLERRGCRRPRCLTPLPTSIDREFGAWCQPLPEERARP